MAGEILVHFYLEDALRQSAAAGTHNFINLITEVLADNGLRPVFDQTPKGSGLSLSHMKQPPDARGLVFRRVYHYPFWQIDAAAQRWQWDVARSRFPAGRKMPDATRFYRFWQKRLFGEIMPRRDGFIYVPLQGKLGQQRSFQSCTPLEMIAYCLANDPTRQVIAGLHPNETYTAEELKALEALAQSNPRLTVTKGQMEHHLLTCDYVVTQNSSVAFSGFFFGKPALLFAQIDFHHITIRADLEALGDSFAQVATHQPDFAKYIWWFWQDQSINAGRDDAKVKIANRLARFGWPIGAST